MKQSTIRNSILARLSGSDYAHVWPLLEPISLKVRQRVETADKLISHAYFVERGIVSMVATGTRQNQIEIGFIGPEGMTGASGLLGADRSVFESFVQVGGSAHRIPMTDLRLAFEHSRSLRTLVLQYVHVLACQLTGTAAANGLAKLDARMARWLLMAQDRLQQSSLPITHDLLSIMLGLHRPGVTRVVASLQARQLIALKRGAISILDRPGLAKVAGSFYGTPEAEGERLFGSAPVMSS